jgi:tetratricopeptide (TPR) repeat protein
MAVEDLYAKACQAVERDNLDYAITLFRQVLAARPDYPDARSALRMTERRRLEAKGAGLSAATAPMDSAFAGVKSLIGGPRKKLEACEDFLEKHPNSFRGLLNAAGAAAQAGFKGEAVNIYKDALRFKPEDKTALRRLSDTLREMGENAEALKYLARLSALEPANRDLTDELRDLEAATHMAAHRVEDAASFRDLIRDKDEAARLEQAGRMAASTDDLRREIVQQEKELETNPNQANRILRLAQLYDDVGEPQKAISLLSQKRQALPDNYEIREKLGDVAISMADAQIAAVAKQAAAEPGDAVAQKKLADLRERRNKYALEEMRWRISQHPTDRELQGRMGRLYYETGAYNEAIAAFQGLVPDARFAVEAMRMLGLCFMKKGQADLALEQFARAIERHPEMDDEGKELRYSLAQAQEESGNKAEALKAYKQIYSQDINYRDVAKKVDALSD